MEQNLIPIDQFNTKALLLIKENEENEEMRKKVFHSFYQSIVEKQKSNYNKSKKVKRYKRIIEITGVGISGICTIGTGLAAILEPYLIPVLPIAIAGVSVGVSSLTSAIITKIGLNRLHKKFYDRYIMNKEFCDRLFILYEQFMKDGKLSKDEYKNFLIVKEEYESPDFKNRNISNLFSEDDIKEINEAVKNQIKEKEIKKLLKSKKFL